MRPARRYSGAATRLGSGAYLPIFAAVSVVGLGYVNGGYAPSVRLIAALVVWWLVAVLAVANLLGAMQRRASVVAIALLGGFALWTLVSATWAPAPESAVEEAARVGLYAGVLLLVGRAAGSTSAWLGASTCAITGLSALALASRLFPSLAPTDALSSAVVGTRLSWPIGYWNGLGALAAVGLPLVIGLAATQRRLALAALAEAGGVILIVVLYLTSSRGGFVSAGIGLLVFVFVSRTWWSVTATVLAGAAGGVAIVGIGRHRVLVDGPLGTPAAAAAGHRGAFVVVGACLLAGSVYAATRTLTPPRWRAPQWLAPVSIATSVVLVGAAIIVAHPVRRLHAFTASPTTYGRSGYLANHLLSSNGNGRWALWTSAIDEWKRYPVLGGGAGSFESWWAEHGQLAQYVQDAHSAYLQALAETGIVGFVLIVAFALTVAVAGIRAAWRARSGELAAVSGGVVAFAVACSIDWIWEVTAVGVLGVALAGVAVRGGDRSPSPATARRFLVAVVAAGIVAVVTLPLVARWQLEVSQQDAARGDARGALSAAHRALGFAPWSADPYVQLALIYERQGRVVQAHADLLAALDRDRRDWRLWLIRARLETKLGEGKRATASLEQAVALNPRSPMWNGYDLPGKRA